MTDNRGHRPRPNGDIAGFLMLLLFATLFGGLILWIWRALGGPG